MGNWTDTLYAEAESIGLNLVGVADGRDYQHLLDGCQRAIVFANGGTKLWDCFIDDLRQHPQHLSAHQHPLDDFVGRWIAQVDPMLDGARRWVQCADETDVFIDFRPLAKAAGLGFPSPVGLLIHPVYGLWVSLRAVLLTTEEIPITVDVSSNPCSTCIEKPCVAACPAGAVTESGWSVQRCAAFHQSHTDCATTCHSRLQCPVGSEYRHCSLQHTYHNNRTIGRQQVAERLQIQDGSSGQTLGWDKWR